MAEMQRVWGNAAEPRALPVSLSRSPQTSPPSPGSSLNPSSWASWRLQSIGMID